MTRTQYSERAFNLFNEGKISEEVYDAMMLNIDNFVTEEEGVWEVIDAYDNRYEFDDEADAYKFCYDYIEKALCDDPEEFEIALNELNEYNEANDLIGYRLKEEE